MIAPLARSEEGRMFCSQCGAEADGRFCWSCGAPLVRPDAAEPAAPTADTAVDWESEIRYDVITRQPGVRELLARQASLAKKRMSGEEFLEAVDGIAKLGVPLATLVEIVQPIYTRLGIGTGKVQTQTFELPPGRVLVGVLCSLARRGQALRSVEQATDGCVLEAALPSDMWSLEGDLVVTIRRADGGGTRVDAATKVYGQLFDWGKSKGALRDLLRDIPKLPA
jgi:hypothetical protein